MGIEAGVGRERSREQDPPHECPFGMLTRTITRVQFAAPSSHGAGSGQAATWREENAQFQVESAYCVCKVKVIISSYT